MLFSELEDICKGEVLRISEDREITDLCIDSRKLSIHAGSVFFAIGGVNHDGHKYIEEATEKGIRLFVVEKDMRHETSASMIKVDSSIEALQRLVAFHRAQFDIPVIGITGSNGKTIIKEWLSTLLNRKYNIAKSPKSYNSQVGVPLSVWQLNNHHTLGLFEAGISKVDEMINLEKIIKPSIGIFTNLGEAHNEGFESQQQKAHEKAMLFKSCEKVIYKKGNAHIEVALNEIGIGEDRRIGWEVANEEEDTIIIKFDDQELELSFKFNDPSSIENAIHCAVLMKYLKYWDLDILKGINSLSSVKMRLELKQATGRSYVIDDTYNNDLHGLEIALDFLNRQNQRPKKSVILSDILQSGMDETALYKKVDFLLKKNGISRFTGIGEAINRQKGVFSVPADFFKTTDDFLSSNYRLQDEIVLVKGARDFRFERIVDVLESKVHGTVLEINLENIIRNLDFYRTKLKPGTKIMAMVKAFAYGGGNFEIANLLQYHKVDYLCVAYVDEAVELRKHGIYIPIMIMNPSPSSFRLLKEYNLEPEIYSLDLLHEFLDYFTDTEKIPGIHIKLETGMNRLGFATQEIEKLIQILEVNKELKVKSIFSHLAGSESPVHEEFTKNQGKAFEAMSQQLLDALWYHPLLHLVNTGGISRYDEYHFDMVRLGVGLYGYDPTELEQDMLSPASTLKSNISQIKKIAKGETIGYGRRGKADADMRIGIVPIGYADGYLRAFGNGVGRMLVNEKLVPTIGNICMDMTMLDLSNVEAKGGDAVVIFGERPMVKDLADAINTIPYEVMTNVGERVRRVFHSE